MSLGLLSLYGLLRLLEEVVALVFKPPELDLLLLLLLVVLFDSALFADFAGPVGGIFFGERADSLASPL